MAAKFIPLYEVEKKLLSDRYLDLRFEQDIDDFVCVRCDRLAIVHFFTNCGHLLCLNCKTIIDNGGFTCPQCNTLITNASERRDEFERRLLALRMKCPNTKYGCQLTTNLAQILEHVGMCKFTREQALPALSTESDIMFSVLNKINEHNGQIVELKMGFKNMNEQFTALDKSKEDLKIELRGLKSDVNIKTRKLQEDIINLKKEIAVEIQFGLETNLKKLIADEFRAIKEEINLENLTMKKEIANITVKVKDMEQLEVQLKEKLNNTQLPRFQDSIEEFLKHKSSISQLEDSFLYGSAQDQLVFESLCLKWTFKDKDLVIPTEKGEREHVSGTFPVYGCQLKAQLKLTVESFGDIRLYLCFKDDERERQKVDIKPLPMVTFIIKDLSRHNKHLIRYGHCPFNYSLQYNEFGYCRGVIKKSQWNALVFSGDASLEVLVLVEPLTIINKPWSVDGTITETIEHYSNKLQMEKEGLMNGHWSPPFLTHAGGYRVAVFMWLDGSIGENKRGLTAEIRFLSDEFDSQLRRASALETSVTLINQLDAKDNISVKGQTSVLYSYFMDIASDTEINTGGFLVNDSLTYHVTVKPIK